MCSSKNTVSSSPELAWFSPLSHLEKVLENVHRRPRVIRDTEWLYSKNEGPLQSQTTICEVRRQ